jgi:hypothetical protein
MGDTASQLATLSSRAPLVVARRMMQMADPTPDAADRRELRRMGSEKLTAMQEGWTAMAMQALSLQQRAWMTWLQSAWTPWQSGTPMQAWTRAIADADSVLAAGLRPATRRVSANARRLSRPRRR